MARIVIIGYGNTLRSDDALGVLAARELEAIYDGNPNVAVLECHGLTPDLAWDMASCDVAIFVDCSAGGEPGQIAMYPIEADGGEDMAMVHFLDPPGLLTWTLRMYGRAPQGMVVTVAGNCFDMGETLTPSVARSLPELIKKVSELVESQEMSHA